MVRTLSFRCRDTSERLGTCNNVNDVEEISNWHSRHERHVRDFHNLPPFNAFLMFFARNLLVFVGDHERVGRTGLLLGRSDLIILIILKVAIGQIAIVLRRPFVVECFPEVPRLRLCEVSEEYFETMV